MVKEPRTSPVEKLGSLRMSRLYVDSHIRQLGPKRFKSVDGSRRLQVYLLPLALHDALTNLGGGLSLFVHGVGIVELFQANRTLGPMYALKTAMKTIVSHPTIAVAVAGLLMQHGRDLGRQFVSMTLKRILCVVAPQLLPAQNRRKCGALGGRSRIVFRHVPILLRYAPGSGDRQYNQT